MFTRKSLILWGLAFLAVSCSPGLSPQRGKKTIQNTGSDTMLNLAQAWSEEFHKIKPDVSVEVSGPGTAVGIEALKQGNADLVNASRRLEPAEAAQVKSNTGKEPKEFIAGYDGLAVYAHKDNPLEEIVLEQLAEIYKEGGKISKWSELGVDLKKICPSDEIVRFSRQSNSGTYKYFREAVLHKGDFKRGSKDMPGSKYVVEAVGGTPCGIGYSGMAYKTDHVKFLKVAQKKGDPSFAPSNETVLSGQYSIARPLFLYTIGEPEGELKDYIDWILSPAGQGVIAKIGYIPLKK
ncbi:MAG: phosphate ABC transporter substrate-binding protein [Planctomycetes bacterium]|nr:phosphate ABC transporter substrate-binding protein [Planctomycetota bacterium]